MTESSNKKNHPYDKVYSITRKFVVPIWRREDGDGKPSFSLSEHQSSYYDKKEDKYKYTTTVFDRDAAELAATYADARDRMKRHREAEYKQRKTNPPSADAQQPANQQETVAGERAA